MIAIALQITVELSLLTIRGKELALPLLNKQPEI
jgi:hypothetical protein